MKNEVSITGKTGNRAIANVPPQPAEAAGTAKTGETAGMAEAAAAANITDSYKTDKPCVADESSAARGENDLFCRPADFAKYLLKRKEDAHKGNFGRLLCVVGSYGMAGAAMLSMRAALRCGVGICEGIVNQRIYPILASAVPEAIFSVYECEKGCAKELVNTVKNGLEKASAVLIGCGCTTGEAAERALETVIKNTNRPIVIDADGINVLSKHIDWLEEHSGTVVLTPHPGEAARLLNVSTADIQKDRISAARAICEKYNAITVLKGHHTVICQKDKSISINPTGNPGMATGGSGDVLAGITASLLAQGIPDEAAVKAAVYIHGAAGDRAAQRLSQRASLPSDTINELAPLFLEFENSSAC